jgi:AGZA family xanthine/uracil permease-like MFS transporter
LIERFFALTERGTSIRTELMAGLTTFLAMAYIVVVNPAILSTTGMPVAAVAAATCLIAGFASIMMGLYANLPLALAPGMGLNAYFAFTVVKGMGVPWETALGCVFLSGVVFLILTFTGIRRLIIDAIPRPLLHAIAAGVGLFIAFIGLRDAGVVVNNADTTVALGNLAQPTPAITLAGLLLIGALQAWRVQGAVLIGVIVSALAALALGLAHGAPGGFTVGQMGATFLKLNVGGAFVLKGGLGFALVEIVFVFLFVDLFDNIGTLVAVSQKAGLVGPDGQIANVDRILVTDSVATIAGALAGTSTVVSYIESAAGVAAGGRTGLTAVTVGVLFLLTLLVSPLVQAIPTVAAAPALILVGSLMMSGLGEIDWADPTVAVPAFLTVVTIPLTFSIANGLAFGLTSYAVLKLLTGKAVKADWLLFVLAALFTVRFMYLSH